ncbi:MAG: hypothetical protein J6B98_01235 [Bacilli bacterium]|nr:hypothetical protein [Bacilli bacterium]
MKLNLKNKYIIILFTLILIILSSFLSIIIYKNHNNKIDIQLSNQIWNTYDDSIDIIKNNMEAITEPNENFDWWILKDFDIEDDDYESVLNLLVADVRTCYLEYTQSEEYLTNPILEYRSKRYITSKELEKLNLDMYNELNQGCLKRFERYDALLISNDKLRRNNVLLKTNKIFRIRPIEIFNNKYATYNELLLRKIIEVHYIEDISQFLVEEYNKLK